MLKGVPVEESNFLLELAEGKHDKKIAAVQRLLRIIGAIWPAARLVSHALVVFVLLNKLTTLRGGVAPDGRGGFVPKTNSLVHPTNGRFIQWTSDGWIYADIFGGKVEERFKPPSLQNGV